MINPPPQPARNYRIQPHPGVQFLIFISMFIAVLIAGNILAYLLVSWRYGDATINAVMNVATEKPHFNTAVWIFQVLGTTIPILAAPLIFSLAITGKPRTYLKTNFRFNPVLLALVLAVMLLSMPMVELLLNINERM